MDADAGPILAAGNEATARDDGPADQGATHGSSGRHGSSDALALAAFSCVAIAAFTFYVVASGRLWFRNDDWDFLAGRRATSINDLFRSHYGHWSTVPILVYRFLWSIVGLNSYRPYLVIVIGLHVVVGALLLAVMRRVGVGTWTATAAASLYLLFGTGATNILYAFQIGFKGALAFGLAHLLLADHEGGISRRDWIALGAGLAAVMCSGVGIVMAGVVGLAMLTRRGWRIALFHAGPLFAAYLAWWSATGRKGQTESFSTHTVIHWVWQNVSGVFGGLTKGTGLAWLLAIIVATGLISALRSSGAVHRLALPLSMAAGGVAFITIASSARSTALNGGTPRASRYEDIVAAMLLPLIAVGVDELRQRWRVLAIAAVALFLAGIPANIGAALDYTHTNEGAAQATRRLVTTLARVPMAREVPRSVKPLHEFPELFVTVGWLLDGARSGRIPNPGPISPAELRVDTFRLSFDQTSRRHDSGRCHPVESPKTLTLQRGATIFLGGQWALLISTDSRTDQQQTLYFFPGDGNVLTLVGETMTVQIKSGSPYLPGMVCDS